jgi:hypothetical protein
MSILHIFGEEDVQDECGEKAKCEGCSDQVGTKVRTLLDQLLVSKRLYEWLKSPVEASCAVGAALSSGCHIATETHKSHADDCLSIGACLAGQDVSPRGTGTAGPRPSRC